MLNSSTYLKRNIRSNQGLVTESHDYFMNEVRFVDVSLAIILGSTKQLAP